MPAYEETVSGRTYTSARVRGFAPWSPKEDTLALVAQVNAILRSYREFLPLTARQIFYYLVGQYHYPKTEQSYAALCEKLNRARRAGMIDWFAIRDDGTASEAAGGWSSEGSFYASVRSWAESFELHKRNGQATHAELWVEASGMVGQAARVARDFGINVYSAGGFNSVTDKFMTAQRLYRARKPVTILHVGDYDPSGLSILDALAADITAFMDGLGSYHEPEFKRIAVTPEQIEEFGLPSAPQKATDNRGEHMDETVQAEAMQPQDLADAIREACEGVTDMFQLQVVYEESAEIRERLVAWVPDTDGDEE